MPVASSVGGPAETIASDRILPREDGADTLGSVLGLFSIGSGLADDVRVLRNHCEDNGAGVTGSNLTGLLVHVVERRLVFEQSSMWRYVDEQLAKTNRSSRSTKLSFGLPFD